MFLSALSDYINTNAPMSNIPELLGLHHSNPLGLHPIAVPILLLVLAVAMRVVYFVIYKKERRSLYPLLYSLWWVAVAATYYYCFSGDLPLFEDVDLGRKEIIVAMLLGASAAGIADDFAPITGIWIMIAYHLVVFLMVVVKLVVDTVRTHLFWRCLLSAVCFLVVFEAVTMLAIECIEGCIYLFLPIVGLFVSADARYKKKQPVKK